MEFGDLWELRKQFGLTAKECGIFEKEPYVYKTNGSFFDHDCDCYLNFDIDDRFISYDLYIYGIKGNELDEKLCDICSGPSSSFVTPYVISNGGAVYTTVYEEHFAVISVSKASNKSYYSINIKPNHDPGFQGVLKLKPAKYKGLFPEGIVVDPVGYDNGILTIEIYNHRHYSFDISDDFELYEHKGSAYYSKFKVSQSLALFHNYSVAPGEKIKIKLDIRVFGKVVPNEYMIKLSEFDLYFVLDSL